ncbi:MAG: DUF4097 domain-containing protein [Acidobacteriota bacterium]|nr:DUF4097 domain-containing protein [Acidobacteriota bacterium]
MKLIILGLLVSVFSSTIFSSPARASDDEGCSANHSWWSGEASFAQSRQERLPNAPVNYVDPGQNGSIKIHGWDNSDVLVKSCIQTAAPSESEARDLAAQVRTTNGAGHIEAAGPASHSRRDWSVSYEIWMPSASAAKLDASNGSIAVEGVRGRLRFHTLNGSVRLTDVGGDVDGKTTNGSLIINVANTGHYEGGLRLETTNGSIKLELPANYSARVTASTVNGSIRTDFPVTVSGEIGKHVSFTVGNGGSEIEAKTTNGSIQISRKA